eukprot:Skav209539  [mRNA]  locus=scaffold2497:127793:128662:+ [translate_table: standard]
MPRFADFALPIALVLLQLVWSGIFQYLPWSGDSPANGTATGELPVENNKLGSAGRVEDNKVAVVDAVKWLDETDSTPGTGIELPLFPLGAFYPPHSHPTLKIFEPRYRQLYQDVLAAKVPEFAVTSVSLETGQLAAFGVVLRVDDVADVAEETKDQVKYLAKHTVMRRIEIKSLVNREALRDTSSYLKALVVPVEDDPAANEDDVSELEADTVESFKELISFYPDFQFSENGRDLKLNASRHDGGLWHFASLWIDGYWAYRARLSQQQLLLQIQQMYQSEEHQARRDAN